VEGADEALLLVFDGRLGRPAALGDVEVVLVCRVGNGKGFVVCLVA